MQSLSGLIVRVERARQPDRRLDAEIIAAVLGPPGCHAVRWGEEFDIETAPDAQGENATWRDADQVGRITGSLEDALTFAKEAQPVDASQIAARAFLAIGSEPELALNAWSQHAACRIVVETLRALAREGGWEATTANLADVA